MNSNLTNSNKMITLVIISIGIKENEAEKKAEQNIHERKISRSEIYNKKISNHRQELFIEIKQ